MYNYVKNITRCVYGGPGGLSFYVGSLGIDDSPTLATEHWKFSFHIFKNVYESAQILQWLVRKEWKILLQYFNETTNPVNQVWKVPT